MTRKIGWGRKTTYATLATLAMVLGAVGPAQAATNVSIVGNSQLEITAVARTTDPTITVKSRFGARAILTYQAQLLGLPLPLTGEYHNSIPTTFATPKISETINADLYSWAYKKKWDPWLGRTQWMVGGDKGFWGRLHVEIRGAATAASKGARHFHAGSGTGHALDANTAVKVTVR